MFYIFNENSLCIGSSSSLPDEEDLSSRNEHSIELPSGTVGNYYSNGIFSEPEEILSSEQIETTSKLVRDTAINSDLLYNGVHFQVSDDCADIKSALVEAFILGLEDSYTQDWRLSDNTWRTTTIAEAKEIVALYVARKQKVWAQYETWTSGNKTSVFEYTEE